MDDDNLLSAPLQRPTSTRPLLGLTILVVDDSRYASEALRLLCLRSGARIRRADCLRSAHRHLQVYRPTVAIVDIGLQDGSGADLIAELDCAQPRTEVILGMSGDPDGELRAMSAGADGFLAKPIVSLSHFQEAVLVHLPAERQPRGPRALAQESVVPDRIAYQDDLAHMVNLLQSSPDAETMSYAMQFLGGVAASAEDHELLHAVDAIREYASKGSLPDKLRDRLFALVGDRLNEPIAM